MSKITYDTFHVVRLDGKIVGEIREVKDNGKTGLFHHGSGFAYFPKGTNSNFPPGEVFATLELCKKSVEEE